MKSTYLLRIIVAAIAAVIIVGGMLLALYLAVGNPEPPAEIAPAVNPLTAQLETANGIIDTMVSFNNLLIRELEECEDEK